VNSVSLDGLNKELTSARKNYRAAVRWYREVLLYRTSTEGDEWRGDDKGWLSLDSKYAHDEVIKDIRYYRDKINKLKKQIEKEEEYGRK